MKFLNLFKKRKIEFYSLIPNLEKLYPIRPAKSYRPEWIKLAAQEYKKQLKNITVKNTTILKCPGINALLNYGYVLYNYCDIVIRSVAESKELKWEYQWEQAKNYPDRVIEPYVGFHSEDLLSKFKTPPYGANPILLKLNTPWRVKAPDDVVFIEMPLFYSDDNRFCVTGGILDPKEGNFIHPSFWWFGNNTESQLLKAGTPLVQYIPIKRHFVDEYKYIVRSATEREIQMEKEIFMLVNLQINHEMKEKTDLINKIVN